MLAPAVEECHGLTRARAQERACSWSITLSRAKQVWVEFSALKRELQRRGRMAAPSPFLRRPGRSLADECPHVGVIAGEQLHGALEERPRPLGLPVEMQDNAHEEEEVCIVRVLF